MDYGATLANKAVELQSIVCGKGCSILSPTHASKCYFCLTTFDSFSMKPLRKEKTNGNSEPDTKFSNEDLNK